MDKKKILIFGSCVSRNALEYDYNKDFELVGYFARSSFASLQSVPNVKQSLLKKIESKFQKNVVEFDMKKSFWDFVGTVSFDLLLIDLIDERFDLLEFPNGAIHTLSNEYLNHLDQPIEGRKISSRSSEHFELWKKGINKLIDVLHKQNALSKLRISEVYYAEFDSEGKPIDGYDKKLIALANKFLQQCYAFLKEIIPEKSFIHYHKPILIANSKHKWGVSPFHFIDQFYVNTIKCLNGECFQKDEIQIALKLNNNNEIEVTLNHTYKTLECEYAFYLLKDGNKEDVRWYLNDCHANFKPKSDGQYCVQCFIKYKKNTSSEIIYSDIILIEKNNSNDKSIGVTFESIDIFLKNYSKASNTYKILVDNQYVYIDFKKVNENKKFFLVCFGGAISNRHSKKYPFFSGINISNYLNLTLLSICDPSLELDDNLSIGWYAGNKNIHMLPKRIGEIIDGISNDLNATPILFGGSAGGFGILSIVPFLKVESFSFIWNPQIILENYYPRFVQAYLKAAFNELPSNIDKLPIENNIINFYMNNKVFRNNKSEILYIQNLSDKHTNTHAMPFVNGLKLDRKSNNLFFKEKITVWLGNWGEGHIPPEPNAIVKIINKFMKTSSSYVVAEWLDSTDILDCKLGESLTLRNQKEDIHKLRKQFSSIVGGDYNKQVLEGFKARKNAPAVNIELPLKWKQTKDRNVLFTLNAWRFINPMWNKFFQTNDTTIFEQIILHIEDWSKQKQTGFYWYDMAVGIRGIHLSLVISIDEILNIMPNKEKENIIFIANRHLEELKNPEKLGHANHAIWQMIGLKHLATRMNDEEGIKYSTKTIQYLIEKAFDKNSINTENSPYYHTYNLNLLKFIDFNLFPELKDTIEEIVRTGKEIIWWLTLPDGYYLQVGDTEGKPLERYKRLNEDAIVKNKKSVLVKDFFESGYQIASTCEKTLLDQSFYFAFHCPKHTVHLHSDYLSFVLIHEGIEVFADAGKYSYEYNEIREWFISDVAHNTLGLSSQRIFPKDIDTKRMGLLPLKVNENSLVFSGYAAIKSLFEHKREITLEPYERIIINDSVRAYTDDDIEIRFLFGESIECKVEQGCVKIFSDNLLIASMKLDENVKQIELIKKNDAKAWVSREYGKRTPVTQLLIVFDCAIKEIRTEIEFLYVSEKKLLITNRDIEIICTLKGTIISATTITVLNTQGLKYAFYLMYENEKVEQRWYEFDNSVNFKIDANKDVSKYFIVGFILDESGKKYQQKSYPQVKENDSKEMLYSVYFLTENAIEVYTLVESSYISKEVEFEYAYYLKKNNELIDKSWYTKRNNKIFDIPVNYKNTFSVEAFLRIVDKKIRVEAQPLIMLGTIFRNKLYIAIKTNFPFDFYVTLDDGDRIYINVVDLKLEFLTLFKNFDPNDFTIYSCDYNLMGISSIKVYGVFGNYCVNIPWYSNKYSLDVIMTSGFEMFRTRFTFASQRHIDNNVTHFIANNNLMNPTIDNRIYINSAVIYAYKSLEQELEISILEESISFLDNSVLQALGMNYKEGARNDKYHLTMSALTAKCHVQLFMGQIDNFFFTLKEIDEIFQDIEFKGYYSINISKIYFIAYVISKLKNNTERSFYFFEQLKKTKVKADNWILADKGMWLYNEINQIDVLLDFINNQLFNLEKIDTDLLYIMLKECLRVKSEKYIYKIIEYIS